MGIPCHYCGDPFCSGDCQMPTPDVQGALRRFNEDACSPDKTILALRQDNERLRNELELTRVAKRQNELGLQVELTKARELSGELRQACEDLLGEIARLDEAMAAMHERVKWWTSEEEPCPLSDLDVTEPVRTLLARVPSAEPPATRPAGHLTDLMVALKRWADNRAKCGLDRELLDRAILYLIEYRTLATRVPAPKEQKHGD